ncbi:Uncharacterized membrane protein YckC, RDD family [Halogranum rubrum]|uniref:Uncharacterized membrane protein YckC, RDD family n=1 Tax=Halogranum rubrum TaxID=553466 RepID=A0A1I4F275_9EURY|nr:RDD family protein [Halogranum rubrum]SFL10876.1 Uncharacterized membrane protein YckC, RDD family [Halogranum rubrum]
MTKLALFGAVHIDRRGKVISELSRFSEGADALFVEYPVDGISFPTVGRALARAPVSALGMLLVTLLHMPGYALFNRDIVPAEVVAARKLHRERDIPLYPVDDHVISILGESSVLRTAAEWVVFLVILALDPVTTGATAGVVVGGWTALSLARRVHRLFWVVAVFPVLVGSWWFLSSQELLGWTLGYVALGAIFYTIFRTISHRNDVMVERIAERCEAEGYDRACLTTGRAHLAGLATAAEDRGVDVVASYVPSWLREGDVVEGSVPAKFGVRTVRGDLDTAGDVFGRRVVALFVDWGVLSVVTLVAGSSCALLGRLVVGSDAALWAGFLVGAVLGWAAYWVGFEARSGQTVGKRVTGLVVVAGDGASLSRRDAVVRTLLRPVDGIVGYVLGAVVALLSDGGRRIGDHAAGTLVVRVEKE